MRHSYGWLVLVLLFSSHGGTAQTGQGARLPYQIVGKWLLSQGSQFLYGIRADGSYEHAGLMKATVSGCTTQVSLYQVGTVTEEGRTLNFVPKSGTTTFRNSCNPSSDSTNPAKNFSESFRWRVASDETGPQLCLTDSQGHEDCYSRQRN